jgi:hypothetical protein
MRVVIDSTLVSATQEVLAVPFDPAPFAPAAHAAVGGASGDSIALYYAAADSADSLDASFQRARAALNSEARTLGRADRRSRDYAARYAAFEARRDSAEALRAHRDRLRARREALRARLGGRVPDRGARWATHQLAAALDSAARAMGRAVVRARARDGVATMELAPGEWWLTVERGDGSLHTPAATRHVRAGARDTVRLRGT